MTMTISGAIAMMSSSSREKYGSPIGSAGDWSERSPRVSVTVYATRRKKTAQAAVFPSRRWCRVKSSCAILRLLCCPVGLGVRVPVRWTYLFYVAVLVGEAGPCKSTCVDLEEVCRCYVNLS